MRTETITESKDKWNKLAKENARYYVLTDFGAEISEEKFREAGKKDFETLITGDAFLNKHLSPFNNKSALEIGCGIGRITEFLASAFGQVTGADISEAMINEGQKRLQTLRNVRLVATDGKTLPAESDSIDFVFSFIVFQHMPDVQTIRANVAEISRVLKIGGLAKIQLRGLPTSKKNWFYGPSFDMGSVKNLIKGLPLEILKSESENTRYFWVWLSKKA